MKKAYLLLLLCSISTINIFAAENKKNEKLACQPIDYWTHINEIDLREQEIAALKREISEQNANIDALNKNMQKLYAAELARVNQFDGDLRFKYQVKDVGTGSASLNVLK